VSAAGAITLTFGDGRAVTSIGALARRRARGHVATRVQAAVTALGCEARVVHPGEPIADFDLLLAYGSAAWYRQALALLAGLPAATRPRLVVWQSEPLPPPRAAGLPAPRLHLREVAKIALRDDRATDPHTNLRALRALARHGLPDRLVVTSHGAAESLAENGIAADVVPIGRYPNHGRDLALERDIDVLFVGALEVPRRRRALRALRKRGLAVEAVGGWGKRGLWGEERTHLVNRARIFVNLSRHPGQFSGERLMLGMANRALVVSEPIYRPDPFVPGTHFVAATPESLPETVERYLEDDAERARIADAGHAFVMEELPTFERSVERVLELQRV
jgi:hypothetical protein